MKRFIILSAMTFATPAFADVIDFSDLAFDGTGSSDRRQFASVMSGDYVFTALQFPRVPLTVWARTAPNNADQGGATLGVPTTASDLGVSFARADGAAFRFTGLQITQLFDAAASPGAGGTFRILFDGALGFNSSYDTNPGFQTYSFAGIDARTVQISSINVFQIDDLQVGTVTNVPEASNAVYLLAGIGLLGGAMALRQKRFGVSAAPAIALA